MQPGGRPPGGAAYFRESDTVFGGGVLCLPLTTTRAGGGLLGARWVPAPGGAVDPAGRPGKDIFVGRGPGKGDSVDLIFSCL